MPRLVHKNLGRPAYGQHRNLGRVCIAGKYHYLPGLYDSAQSRQAYWALIGRLERGELAVERGKAACSKPAKLLDSIAPQLLTAAEMVEKYKEHVDV
jgi:hypothetical protein